ncbi:Bromodomain containing protein [Trichomonas vaginalis G3]|uniref:Bromodomain containing protein n=1 Tax=Trichomonas vaginalis (strain ATCC PRA-98 / G3) TaxID=412133 RepID=A2EAC6_TRIV3|nr:chromatin remodeling [Trichomonas vaginalis G3]EAY10353.1 Bromodomain containing protein [Trichomonas vaginalis G3]KAI5485364.1 chromatin remodeling [Trichomonas vaginalis G3]|eukprot:XP_001322576.1 Bromodomain containing protein [Trichomonas vaginalis G3]
MGITPTQKQRCQRIIEQIRRYRISKIFDKSVDRDLYPNYYEIIKSPMALEVLEIKLRENRYNSIEEFKSDIALIWDNAVKFNGETNWITMCANYLRIVSQKLVAHFTDDPVQDWLTEFKIIDVKVHKIYKYINDPKEGYPKAGHKHHGESSKSAQAIKESKQDHAPVEKAPEPERRSQTEQRQKERRADRSGTTASQPPAPEPAKPAAPANPPPPPAPKPAQIQITDEITDQILDKYQNGTDEDVEKVSEIIAKHHPDITDDSEIDLKDLSQDCRREIARYFKLI